MGNVRKRLNAKKKGTKDGATKKSLEETEERRTAPIASQESGDGLSMWATIRGHWSLPFYVITVVVSLPFLLHSTYLYLLLERPDLISRATFGRMQLRPAVGVSEPRQVLIIGTISGGTSQAAEVLKRIFGLEIEHETSETTRHFCRDGTVSWFHGLRFMPPRPERMSLTRICSNFTPSMGFHPSMYRNTSGCSLRETWSKCWAKECLVLLHREWGCAWHDDENYSDLVPCETPYQRTLHQVRHPVRTIESLITKFCHGNLDGELDEAFLTFAKALFPQHHEYDSYSCIEASAYFVDEYHRAMLRAGQLIDKMYRIEETSPCKLAQYAGFVDDDLLWEPSRQRVVRTCSAHPQDHMVHSPMEATENKVNLGRLTLSRNDFLGGVHGSSRPSGDQRVLQTVTALVKDLGHSWYDEGEDFY